MPRSSTRRPPLVAELERAKQRSLGQVLLKSARLLDEQAIALVRARTGEQGLRRSHTAVLPHVDFEGTRLSVLAERLGVSKQAAGQLVDDLEAMGVMERVPDPADARAKLVRYSRKGQRALLHGLGVLREIEREAAAALGPRRMEELARLLSALLAFLEERGRRAPG